MRGASDTPGGFWWENLRESDRYEKPVVDGRNRFILKDTEFGGRGRGMYSSGSGWGQAVASCERGDEPSGSQNARNFLTRGGAISF